jgi:hypothetical protein
MEHLGSYIEYDMMEVVNDHWLSLLVYLHVTLVQVQI